MVMSPPTEQLAPGKYLRLSEVPDCNRATFRVLTGASSLDRVVFECITNAVGVEPEQGPAERGRWRLRSERFVSVERSLDEHVTALLGAIEPGAEDLRRVLSEHELPVDFFCGHGMGSYNTGFSLRPATLARVAALDARLVVDIYASRNYDESVVVIG
jgi:hypothetical protein